MKTAKEVEPVPVVETAAVVLRLSAFVHDDEGLWVAGCPSLDVFSQGHSEADAKKSLREAVELWIDSCLERNKLGEALRELGWYRVPPGTTPSPDTDLLGVVEDHKERPDGLGAEYPLHVTIPAYQAALFSGASSSAHR